MIHNDKPTLNILNGITVQQLPQYLRAKKHTVLQNMKRKTRREKEVKTNPERMIESGSHQTSTERPHPGK